jgi:hypothetical protein
MPERGRKLRGRKGKSLDCGGFWLLNDEDGADFIPTDRSAVDQLADLVEEPGGEANPAPKKISLPCEDGRTPPRPE